MKGRKFGAKSVITDQTKITLHQITALILAGGKASRFNGEDKGLIQFLGKPMIQHIIDSLKTQVSQIIISANRNIEQYKDFGYPVVQDPTSDLTKLQGPLAGIHQGLILSTTPWVVLSACDTPFIPLNYCETMIQAIKLDLEKPSEKIVVATCQNKLQPLFALIPTEFKHELASALSKQQFKVGQWISSMPHITLDFPDNSMFTNINSTQDLKQWGAEQE